MAYKQQMCVSHSSGGWQSKAKVLADSVSGEGFLAHRWYLLTVSTHDERSKGALWTPFVRT